MSDKLEGLNRDILAAIVSRPGQSIINIIELFSGKASKNTIRTRIKQLTDSGLITAHKETVVRPTVAGKRANIFHNLENVGGQLPREEDTLGN
jgi:hypothetical protein